MINQKAGLYLAAVTLGALVPAGAVFVAGHSPDQAWRELSLQPGADGGQRALLSCVELRLLASVRIIRDDEI
jgi:hypothetical protein